MGLGRVSFAIGLALLVGAAPLAAQATNTINTTGNAAAPANQPPVVGPKELQDFSLGGTVTRRAAPAPAPAAAPPASAPATRTDRAPAGDAQAARIAPRITAPAASAPARRPALPDAATTALGDPGMAVTPAPPEPIIPEQALPSQAAPLPAEPAAPSWPWLLAALAVAGGAAFLWWRRRAAPDPAYAGVSEALFVAEPAPPPQPAPAPTPAPRTPARPVGGGGIVARSLEPRIAFEFKPLSAEYTAQGEAALTFELVVINTGGAPARQVLVEGKMLNAGPDLDLEVAKFFQAPVALGDRIPVIMPQAKISVRSRVLMTADRLKPVEIEGRKLLVPVIAFNALYKSSGSGDRQDSASFLVGRGGEDGGKMGPLPIDRGPRSWDGLGWRAHSAGLNR